ncbi:DEAD/DEAH box helicase [Alkalispirochaeta alkalica]|uniref:DEAD/DEAH box helicase n=1 Tax=Alkalispirochaeta alkalica TaxID=46356 RepID=UPI0003A8345E|nr:DEAD/DEAH box helicase [Alkalispirochaeta alkalica]
MHTGIYEQLITDLLRESFEQKQQQYFIQKRPLDPAEAGRYLSTFLQNLLCNVLESLPYSGEGTRLERQVLLANEFIRWLSEYLQDSDINENLLHSQGELLTAFFNAKNPVSANLKKYTDEITPQTGLVQSELFTGCNSSISLESEMKREILSSDEICWLVSFIKWTGIRIFAEELRQVTTAGTKLRVLTTSYMGATDQKAVDFLCNLPNTEVRVNYNTDRERLHAKAYLFLRESGFHTGYIGSSNISRSALTNGLEWNLKLTTQEIPHILEKFNSTFSTYWESSEFENYTADNSEQHRRLELALSSERGTLRSDSMFFFDIQPHPYQKEMLEHLRVERETHGRFRNLVVAATGTGKTIISAFDFSRFFQKNTGARLLFIAHREEILKQALASYRAILRQPSFGELFCGGTEPSRYDHVFATIQTIGNRLADLPLTKNYYDYIVIDEVHHIAASSYRPILENFTPTILLGLTATPERHDGADILEDFCGTIAAELRLPDAINQRHLCPFQYFGLDDPTDLSRASWERGRYLPGELTRLYTENDARVMHIIQNITTYITDFLRMKALAFCVSQDHANYMADKFQRKGIPASVLTSANRFERTSLREKLVRGEINVLCLVDIFNEGIDIPEIDTLLFLRPTESLTVFLQQLGRGLRLSEGKDCLTVLDFVGNARPEYDFSQKFRAIVGQSHTSVQDEIENDFPHAPLGCSIILQKQAREIILRNIRNAIVNKKQLLRWLRDYPQQSCQKLTLRNFLHHYPNVRLADIYKTKIDGGGGWTRLQYASGLIAAEPDPELEIPMHRALYNRLIPCTSWSYLNFVYNFFKNSDYWDKNDPIHQQYAIMLHYDFWRSSGSSLESQSMRESLNKMKRDKNINSEIIEVVAFCLSSIENEEIPMNLPYPIALNQHARYSRDQILSAFGAHRFEKKSNSREGVVFLPEINSELLFVTLQKTEKRFSPTTLYHDYAISENLFHWQSQNSARPDRGKGLDYIRHQEKGTSIILFAREQSQDEYKRAMGFVCLGPVKFVRCEGSQPMSITWRLETSLPPWLWHSAAKLAVG